MIKRFICHCKNWNSWRKSSLNSKLYKLHIFFRPKESPTFMLAQEYVISNGKIVLWSDEFMRGVLDGLKGEENDRKT